MSHSAPTRPIKCQICAWTGVRRYGSNGILCDPCPECWHRVTYATSWDGDPPITPDNGEVRQPSKPRRAMTPEHKARLAAGRAFASCREQATRTIQEDIIEMEIEKECCITVYPSLNSGDAPYDCAVRATTCINELWFCDEHAEAKRQNSRQVLNQTYPA